MGLKDLIKTRTNVQKKVEIDKDHVRAHLEDYQRIISYWRKYPDKFVDYLCSLNPDNQFKFYFSQRLYLRLCMRFRTFYAVFSRGFSKSFLAVLCLMLKCVLYPGAKLATVADGKSQSASILSDKMNEICTMIPALAAEIMWDTRGKVQRTSQTKDSVTFTFKNNSILQNVAMTENARGTREQGVLVEECAKIDQDKLQEIVMPMMTISRQVKGQVDPDEVLNQSSVFVTSAGFKDSFAFQKLIQTLCEMIANPKEAFIIGGDWKIPVVEGLQPANFIQSQEMDDSLEEGGFEREYGSVWSGNVVGAFFDSTLIDKHRVLNQPEYQYNEKLKGTKGYYVLGVDVGRFDDQTEVVVIKMSPTQNNTWVKKIVNIITIKGQSFIPQAIELKRIFNKYNCRAAVVDGNGLGAGLVDILVVDQNDPDTGEILGGWGVINDERDDNGHWRYKELQTENTIHDAMWIMKANVPLNSEMYSYCQAELRNGRIKFLIDDNLAKNKLLAQEQGKKMSAAERAEYLLPFIETTFLKSQMTNLVQETENVNVILKQSSKKIKKDKVSALIYGLYYCSMEEKKRKNKKNRDLSKLMLFTSRNKNF